MFRLIVVVGGPGKTTLCRYLSKQAGLYPLLLVDNTVHHHPNTLHQLIGADDVPSLSTMQKTPQYDLQQAEWTLAEGLTNWGSQEVELLNAGLNMHPLTPLWKSACNRLFKRFNTVVMDEWQMAWTPWLREAQVLGIAHTPPPITGLEDAQELKWLQLDFPPYLSVCDPDQGNAPTANTLWSKLGRVPWVDDPVRKNPDYQRALTAMLERLG